MTYVLYIVIGVACLGLLFWMWKDLQGAKHDAERRERELRDPRTWCREKEKRDEDQDRR